MDTVLLLVSCGLVGTWVIASSFSMEVIRHFENVVQHRRVADGRVHLIVPSQWQAAAV